MTYIDYIKSFDDCGDFQEEVRMGRNPNLLVRGTPVWDKISFSSYNPRSERRWLAAIPKRYQIVLLPGYKVPPSLVCDDINSIYFPHDVTEMTPVWDATHPQELENIIIECFDPFCEMSDFIKIWDTRYKKFVAIDPVAATWHADYRINRIYPGDTLSNERMLAQYNYYQSFAGVEEQGILDDAYHYRRPFFSRGGHSRVHRDSVAGHAVEAWFRVRDSSVEAKPYQEPRLMFGYGEYLRARKAGGDHAEQVRSIDFMELVKSHSPISIALDRYRNSIPMTPEEEEMVAEYNEREYGIKRPKPVRKFSLKSLFKRS